MNLKSVHTPEKANARINFSCDSWLRKETHFMPDDSVPNESLTPAVECGAGQNAPEPNQVFERLIYGLSLPERALRTTTAVVGGILRESTSFLIPQSFQDSRSYRMFVTQMLNFAAEDIGGVKQRKTEGEAIDGFVAKKTVSNFIELAGLATLHVSPLTVLAIVSDLAYGSNTFLKELSTELKKQGVIDQKSTIDSTADFLAAISDTSGRTAQILDLPPLSIEGLKKTIDDTRASLNGIDPTTLIPQPEIERFWAEIRATAQENEVNLFQIGSAMSMFSLNQVGTAVNGALTTIRVSGNLFDSHILSHYRKSLDTIHEKGLYSMLADSSQPYMDAIWYNFANDRGTVTGDIFSGKLINQAWSGLRGFFQKDNSLPAVQDDSPGAPSNLPPSSP